jgi:excisionase family DNA binding protein
MTALSVDFPQELIEQIAQRAAELIADRPSQTEGFLDVEGAASFLACPKSRIYSLVSAKRIPFHKDGSRTLFDRAELHEYVRTGGARRP